MPTFFLTGGGGDSQYFLFLTSMSDTVSQSAKPRCGEFVEGVPLNLVSRITQLELDIIRNTTYFFPPMLRMTGPVRSLLAMMMKGEGDLWRGSACQP